MTPDDIAADRAVIAAATPGPWKHEDGTDVRTPLVDGPHRPGVAGFPAPIRIGSNQDAAFVARARTRWPAALDEVERLRAELDKPDDAGQHGHEEFLLHDLGSHGPHDRRCDPRRQPAQPRDPRAVKCTIHPPTPDGMPGEACGNDARYIDALGRLCCATCPIKLGIDSIKITAVPELLAWARANAERWANMDGDRRTAASEVRAIIGRRPTDLPMATTEWLEEVTPVGHRRPIVWPSEFERQYQQQPTPVACACIDIGGGGLDHSKCPIHGGPRPRRHRRDD